MADKTRGCKDPQLKNKAVELFETGISYSAVGKALGISEQAAYKHIQSVYAERRENSPIDVDVEKHRDMQILGSITPSVLFLAQQGDVKCVDEVLKILERRAKYLGLDAPAKQEVKTQQAVVFGDGYEVL